MKKTIDLLKEVEKLGFKKDHALYEIDMALDEVLGFENRINIDYEIIPDALYNDILIGFIIEKEEIGNTVFKTEMSFLF